MAQCDAAFPCPAASGQPSRASHEEAPASPSILPGAAGPARTEYDPGLSSGEKSARIPVRAGAAACGPGTQALSADEAHKLLRAAWMAELPEGLCLNLADPLAGNAEELPDLLKRVIPAHVDAEAVPEHHGLPRGEGVEGLADVFLEAVSGRRLIRLREAAVLDEVSDMRVIVIADRVSMEIGSFAILRTLRIFSSGMLICCASSSGVGSRPFSWSICLETRLSLLMVSIMWTGILMVRA